MWRREPPEVGEAQRIRAAFIGVCIGIASLRVLGSVFPNPIRLLLTLLSTSAIHFPILGLAFNPVTHIRRILALRRAQSLPSGPKFVVRALFSFDEKHIGEDTGVLRLNEGCLYFDGLRLDFSIPRDRLSPVDNAPVAVDVEVDGQILRIAFPEIERIEAENDAFHVENALADFWKRPSTGTLVPPPLTGPPKISLRSRWLAARTYVFWVAIVVIAVAQDIALEDRGAKDARFFITCTFAATLAVAAISPLLRYRKLLVRVKADLPPSARKDVRRSPLPASFAQGNQTPRAGMARSDEEEHRLEIPN